MSKDPLVITDYQVCTCAGFDAAQTGASIACGIPGFTLSPWFYCIPRDPEIDEEDQLVTGMVPFLDQFYTEHDRLLDMSIPFIKKVFSSSQMKRKDLERTGIFFSVTGLEGMEEEPVIEKWFKETMANRLSIPEEIIAVDTDGGPVMMMHLIRVAEEYLRSGQIDIAIVGGVDSWLLGERLPEMDRKRRLKSNRNPDGFIPGEASSVLVLQTESKAASRNNKPLAYITGIGIAEEPFDRADRSSSGRGLRDAIIEAQGDTPYQCKYVIGNHNGDNYRGKEWGTLISLMPERLSMIEEFIHPADCTGDTGAAAAGVMISYALHSFSRGFACDDKCLIWCSSDSKLRSAICIKKG